MKISELPGHFPFIPHGPGYERDCDCRLYVCSACGEVLLRGKPDAAAAHDAWVNHLPDCHR